MKVQRPNLRHVVVRDIYILRLGVCFNLLYLYYSCHLHIALLFYVLKTIQLGLLQKIVKRKSDPRLYADELGKGLLGELNYNLEAANALEFMVNLSSRHNLVTFDATPLFKFLKNNGQTFRENGETSSLFTLNQ